VNELSLDEQVESLFPVGGPYGDEETRAAGRSIAALVRYLNHATWHDSATPYPSTVDSLTHSLAAAAAGLEQLLAALGRRMETYAADPQLYDDRRIEPNTAVSGFIVALIDAIRASRDLSVTLQRAGSESNHLGLREPDDPREPA
jgi:hypothetical protein